MQTATDFEALFWALRTEHIASGGIVPPTIYELTAAGDFEAAVGWLAEARDSDFRDRPFRGI